MIIDKVVNKLELLQQEGRRLSIITVNSNGVAQWYSTIKLELGLISDNFEIPVDFYEKSVNELEQTGDIGKTLCILEQLITDIKSCKSILIGSKIKTCSGIVKIELLIERFHKVVQQLRWRYDKRPTVKINDEYDVQDLFHSLLVLYFEDIRREEVAPAMAGSSSRIDFLLPDDNIGIEIKKSREGLKDKQATDQLIVDIFKYKEHPNCRTLICFIYDPEHLMKNPRGIEKDLSKPYDCIDVKVYIRPLH